MEIQLKPETERYTYDDLVEIVAMLRAPGGCPWDREQTHESIKRNLVEEAYELVEAIDGKNPAKIADESGDLLLQVVFHAIIAKDGGEYEIDDVSDAICRKLIHRHPHVFGEVAVSGSDEVLRNWDAIKRADRKQRRITDELLGVSSYLPALMRCEKIQKKAEKNGFSLPNNEELIQLTDSVDKTTEEEKLGQLLFDTVKLCRSRGVDPELALSSKIKIFISEFEQFEEKKLEG